MQRDIIVGYDGLARSRDALALAESLAASHDARVVVACVYSVAPDDDQGRAEALQTAQQGRALLARPAEAEAHAVPSWSAAPGLFDLAGERDAAALVIGSSQHGEVGRIVPGSVASRILAGAPCAVGVAPVGYADRELGPLHLLGAAFDESPESERALHLAERLTARLRGKLRIIGVAEPDTDKVEEISRQLDEAVASAPVSVHAEGWLRHGEPAEQLAIAGKNLDLIVCGSRGYGPFRQVVLGSVSSELVTEARCPILIVPRGDPVAEPAIARPASAGRA